MFKNVAAKFIVFAFDTVTGVAKTGDAANLTGYVSKDYGAVTVLGDTSATEMDATNAPGYYLFDAAQAETNADVLLITGKSATANIAVVGAPATIFTRPTTGWLAPATAGRTLNVDASGRALADLDTIKTNPVVNAGTVTFPTTATLASTTNITAGTITTATNVTTVNGLAANVITATSINADAITAAKIADGAIDAATFAADAITAAKIADDVSTEIANKILDTDMTAHQTQGTLGQAIGDPVADTNTIFKAVVTDATGANVAVDVVDLKTQIGTAGAGLTNIDLPNQTMNIVGNITGNVSGSVGSVTAGVTVAVGGIGSTSFAAGAIDSAAIAADAIGASEIAADAIGASEFSQAAADKVLGASAAALPELAQATPSATPKPADLLMLLYMALRNASESTSTERRIKNDAGTVITKATMGDDGTTFTQGELVAGP